MAVITLAVVTTLHSLHGIHCEQVCIGKSIVDEEVADSKESLVNYTF